MRCSVSLLGQKMRSQVSITRTLDNVINQAAGTGKNNTECFCISWKMPFGCIGSVSQAYTDGWGWWGHPTFEIRTIPVTSGFHKLLDFILWQSTPKVKVFKIMYFAITIISRQRSGDKCDCTVVYNGSVVRFGSHYCSVKLRFQRTGVTSLSSVYCLRKFTVIVQTDLPITSERRNWEREMAMSLPREIKGHRI